MLGVYITTTNPRQAATQPVDPSDLSVEPILSLAFEQYHCAAREEKTKAQVKVRAQVEPTPSLAFERYVHPNHQKSKRKHAPGRRQREESTSAEPRDGRATESTAIII